MTERKTKPVTQRWVIKHTGVASSFSSSLTLKCPKTKTYIQKKSFAQNVNKSQYLNEQNRKGTYNCLCMNIK